MTSSPPSSPASRGVSPMLLTPRSKIRALLATVESSDEEDSAQGGKPRETVLRGVKEVRTQGNRALTQDDDSDDSEILVRPRGKLASRMQVDGAAKGLDTDAPETTEGARERVRKMLKHHEGDRDDDGISTQADEDDDLPVAPRRLKRRSPAASRMSHTSRSPSPGLFVSSPMRPSPIKSVVEDEREDSENELPTLKSDRFKALVERKRQERLAREAAEETRKAERSARQEKLTSELDQLDSEDDDGGITDDEGGRRLTQEGRPTRKASKRAIEEMNRETQRMARSMQLAHEAKTRKKISKASLFERFNYKPAGDSMDQMPHANSSTPPQSDVESRAPSDTPPSSPPGDRNGKSLQGQGPQPATETTNSALTSVAGEIREAAEQPTGKRRFRVRLPEAATNLAMVDPDGELEITTRPRTKLDSVFENISSHRPGESKALQALRALAYVEPPEKEARGKHGKSTMTPGQLQAYLRVKAREQAKIERERRLETLREKGIIIQTAEEREKQELEVEDLVAKARDEAQRIMKEERDEAKRLRKASGEKADPLDWDDSDDEEYDGSAEQADADMDLSGSEEEEEGEGEEADEDEAEDEEDEDESEEKEARQTLFQEEADSVASEPEEHAQDDEMEDELEQKPFARQRKTRKVTAVLSDDEDSIEATPRPSRTAAQTTPVGASAAPSAAPNSVLRSAKKTFIPGLPVQGPAGLGLTQIFAGTMDSQMGSPSLADGPTQSMMPDFDFLPPTAVDAADEMIVDSQVMQGEETVVQTQAVAQLSDVSQTQAHEWETSTGITLQTQTSEMMELTQDGGLQNYSPLLERFIEPPVSTVETVLVDQPNDEPPAQDSPLARRGRLRRRMDMSLAATAVSEASETKTLSARENVFETMRNAAEKDNKSRAAEEFDRKKSKAKEMIEEQAMESEDEYAGLGGADGEDSDSESNGSVEEMIDDAAVSANDERKIAAFYADRERAQDEQQVEKLFNDITKGMLRRKRGADFDLSDSDDDGEARRRLKRRQFAKMQKALFADERVKKIAESPGNQAFLRTIEDRGSDDDDDEVNLLDVLGPSSQTLGATDDDETDGAVATATAAIIPDSQPTAATAVATTLTAATRRQPLRTSTTTSENTRPPAHLRRTNNGKKPSNIGDVRQTLSTLLDNDPRGSAIAATDAGFDSSSSDEEGNNDNTSARNNKENLAPAPPSKRSSSAAASSSSSSSSAAAAAVRVVDRISLKRNASASSSSSLSSSSSSSSSSRQMAFMSKSSASTTFKVPALLRRATTNSSHLLSGPALSSTSSTSSSSSFSAAAAAGTSTGTNAGGGFGEDAKIRKGAGKRSGIGGFTAKHAAEQQQQGNGPRVLQPSERRRQERKAKGAERRIGMVGGLLGQGSFE